MATQFQVRILQPDDVDLVREYARSRQSSDLADPIAAELFSWSAPWRQESLQHYLPQGWSFGAIGSGGRLLGYALAQPLLFFRGQTQTLWVEGLDFDNELVGQELMMTVYRWARDKHIQKLIVKDHDQAQTAVPTLGGQRAPEGWWEINTTRSRV